MKRILFISGSLGLGHIIRDLAIAKELRDQNPDMEISWLACTPASDMLREAGERLLPESDRLDDENLVAERVSSQEDYRLSLMKWFLFVAKTFLQHVYTFLKIMRSERFDLVIGDETYGLIIAFGIVHRLKTAPFVAIIDCIGFFTLTGSLLERAGVYLWNCLFVLLYWHPPPPLDPIVFVGDEEDIPDERYGFLLPSRRAFCKSKNVIPAGYILNFNPEDYQDREKTREKLGYGREPLVVASIGGTAVGGALLELCGKAYPIAKEAIPNLRMVLVCGPRLPAASLPVPEGVEVREYVPELYKHFAACDLAIIHGGGTSTLELTALRRPFLFFPLEGQFEQKVFVANRLARHGAGINLSYSETTPQILAQHIIENIGKEVTWPPIATDGARRAAEIISGVLASQSQA